jgi:hypothetical protein
MAAKKKPATKDMSPKTNVKGGIVRKPIGNDNITLLRARRP